MNDATPDQSSNIVHSEGVRIIALLRIWTLFYRRGVIRFMRFWVESLLGPMVSTMLFMTVFALALGPDGEMVPGLTALQFIAPGLAVFVLSQTAFQNVCFMLIIDKQEGVITDVLMAPLSPIELLFGYSLAGIANALLVALLLLGAMTVFTGPMLYSLGVTLFFAISAALLFSMIGVLVGLWSDKWDQFSLVDNFLVLPLGLLSGTFFTLNRIPESWQWLFEANPMFWIISGFRYGITGYGSVEDLIWQGGTLVCLVLIMMFCGWLLFKRGYKIKS